MYYDIYKPVLCDNIINGWYWIVDSNGNKEIQYIKKMTEHHYYAHDSIGDYVPVDIMYKMGYTFYYVPDLSIKDLPELVITCETLIVLYFKRLKKSKKLKKAYLTIDKLKDLIGYIHQKIVDDNLFSKYSNIVFNITDTEIDRTLAFNNKVFEELGNRIYIKNEKLLNLMIEKQVIDENLQLLIDSFYITQELITFAINYNNERTGENID